GGGARGLPRRRAAAAHRRRGPAAPTGAPRRGDRALPAGDRAGPARPGTRLPGPPDARAHLNHGGAARGSRADDRAPSRPAGPPPASQAFISMVTRAPPSGRFCACTRPPWARAIVFTTASPSPAEPRLPSGPPPDRPDGPAAVRTTG